MTIHRSVFLMIMISSAQQRWRLNDSETETGSANVITAEVAIEGRISLPSNKYGTANGWEGEEGEFELDI